MIENVLNTDEGWMKAADGRYIKIDPDTKAIIFYSGPIFPDTNVPETPNVPQPEEPTP